MSRFLIDVRTEVKSEIIINQFQRSSSVLFRMITVCNPFLSSAKKWILMGCKNSLFSFAIWLDSIPQQTMKMTLVLPHSRDYWLVTRTLSSLPAGWMFLQRATGTTLIHHWTSFPPQILYLAHCCTNRLQGWSDGGKEREKIMHSNEGERNDVKNVVCNRQQFFNYE